MNSKVDCGIYQFRNIENGKLYIGSSVDVYKRKGDHLSLLRNNKHHSSHFQHAWNKYGQESFIWEILEECDPEDLIIREQFYFDIKNPEYNICKNVRNSLGVKRSEETKQKISESKKGKYSGKNHYGFGKKRSSETLQKMSVGIKEIYKIKGKDYRKWEGHTEEFKKELSEKMKGTKRPKKSNYTNILQIDKETNEILNCFANAREAANSINRFNKSDSSKIIRACRESYRSAFGYKWTFKYAQLKFGEFRETPEVDNPDPSLENTIEVSKKEQRIESEEVTNNLSTSAELVEIQDDIC